MYGINFARWLRNGMTSKCGAPGPNELQRLIKLHSGPCQPFFTVIPEPPFLDLLGLLLAGLPNLHFRWRARLQWLKFTGRSREWRPRVSNPSTRFLTCAVLIVGAGVVGLTMAVLLANQGYVQ